MDALASQALGSLEGDRLDQTDISLERSVLS